MNNDQEKNSIKDRILNEIKKGDIKMHPKFHFLLRLIILTTIIVLLILVIVFLISFIVFSSENNGARFLLGSGFSGVMSLMHSLPWIIILIVLIVILLIEGLVKKFKFAYRRPLIYSLLIILIIGLACGLLMHHESFHRTVSCLLNDSFLSGSRLSVPSNVHEGRVYRINENEIEIMDLNGQILQAIFPSESFKLQDKEFERGDRIIFTGPQNGPIINISSYRKLNCGCGGCNIDDLDK